MEQTDQTEQTDQSFTLTNAPLELAIVHNQITKIIRLTDIGLRIPEDLTFDEWFNLLRSIKWYHKKLTIAFADVIEYGNTKFGTQRVNDSLDQLEFDLPFVKAAISVNSVPVELKHPELSAEHYIELAKADLSKKDKIKWAELAAKLKLTPTQLRLSMAAGEVVDTAAARALATGIITIPGIRQEFDVWLHRIGGYDGVRKLEQDTQQEIYEELEPIMEFALHLQEDIEGDLAE